MKKLIMLVLAAAFLAGPSIMAQKEPPAPQAPEKGRKEKREKSFNFEFKMSAEEEQKMMESFSEETKKALEFIKGSDNRAYERVLRKAQYKKFAMMDMHFPKHDNGAFEQKMETRRKMMELEIQSQALGIQYEKADAAQKAKFKSDLQAKLSQLFDMKEAEQKEEVQNLEKRVAELKEKLDVRQKNKSQIIERKMQDYLGEEDYLEW